MRQARLPGIRQTLHLKKTESTQDLARRLAEKGAPAWTLVWADEQTLGRGRMDRRWSSQKGGLYISLILRPDIVPAQLAELSLKVATACAKAIAKETGLMTWVKPPNDVLASPQLQTTAPSAILSQGNGLLRKVCGLLLEASGDSCTMDWLVIGIGVNVHNRLPNGLTQAASLSQLVGRAPPIDSILKALLRELRRLFAKTAHRTVAGAAQ